MQSAIFSTEDNEFMDAVKSDLNNFIRGNNLNSVKAVLVFPPFNNFRRFLVHKIVEDTYISAGLSTFSIGKDSQRRIIVCHSALKIRLKTLEEATKNLSDKSHIQPRIEMIDKDVPKTKATASIYRPPAARRTTDIKESKTEQDTRLNENKKSRVRRPDIQVYVPRPKRVSYGDIEQNKSPPLSSTHLCNSRRSDDLPQQKRLASNTSTKTTEDTIKLVRDEELVTIENNDCDQAPENVIKTDKSIMEISPIMKNKSDLLSDSNLLNFEQSNELKSQRKSLDNVSDDLCIGALNNSSHIDSSKCVSSSDETSSVLVTKSENKHILKSTIIDSENVIDAGIISDDSLISSNSSDEIISISSTSSESSDDLASHSESSSSSNKPVKKSKHDKDLGISKSKHSSGSRNEARKDSEKDVKPEELNLKNRRILHGKQSSDVLIISGTGESECRVVNNPPKQDVVSSEKCKSTKPAQIFTKEEKSGRKSEKSAYNPDDYEWDALFTDDGECLVPEFMEELTKSVGHVKITTAKSDYRQFQTEEERSGDGECIIEIYDFPAEYKTNDLLNIFAAYRNRGFQIKWVDDTHALGIFGSPLVADEVLTTALPNLKTRPLKQAIPESRIKARNLVLPPMERPKTCPALARRLVTGALGLRLPTASKEREAEKLVLKEAREKRRQEAKHREAIWEGTFN